MEYQDEAVLHAIASETSGAHYEAPYSGAAAAAPLRVQARDEHFDRVDISKEWLDRTQALVTSHEGDSLQALYDRADGIPRDAILAMGCDRWITIVTTRGLIASEPERVPVYSSPQRAYLANLPPIAADPSNEVRVAFGATVHYRDRDWKIIELAGDKVAMVPVPVPNQPVIDPIELRLEYFDEQVRVGAIRGVSDGAVETLEDRLRGVPTKDIEIGWQRLTMIDPFIREHVTPKNRTQRDWVRRYWESDKVHSGWGVLGLIPEWRNCGPRERKLPDRVIDLIHETIEEHFKNKLAPPFQKVYWKHYVPACQAEGLIPASESTFRDELKKQPEHEVVKARFGPKHAHDIEPSYGFPLLATRAPWFMGTVHGDDTEMPWDAIDSYTGDSLGCPNLSVGICASTLSPVFLVYGYLPSSDARMALCIRDMVDRWGMIADTLILDHHGANKSTFLQKYYARKGGTLILRRKGKARDGGPEEGFNHLIQELAVYGEPGNTQARRNPRKMTPDFDPVRHFGRLTLAQQFEKLTKAVFVDYDQMPQKRLGMSPREARELSRAKTGPRGLLYVTYGRDLLIATAPWSGSRTREVGPQGVKVDNVHFNDRRLAALRNHSIEVRPEILNAGLAYADIGDNEWIDLRSEYTDLLRTRTRYEVAMISDELRRRSQRVTAAKLARRYESADDRTEREQLQLQRAEQDGLLFHAIEAERLDRDGRPATTTEADADEPDRNNITQLIPRDQLRTITPIRFTDREGA